MRRMQRLRSLLRDVLLRAQFRASGGDVLDAVVGIWWGGGCVGDAVVADDAYVADCFMRLLRRPRTLSSRGRSSTKSCASSRGKTRVTNVPRQAAVSYLINHAPAHSGREQCEV
ncbi:hypothetical protein AOQ84DRAFT_351248 [Glonium stellatum]|uniref:Uncharacterized protein n=1 Tax=Glonium stellatum TaxID=574774 RepID=A0A8E2JZ68_9PEZI|nr:hypothetical protein AOQ84DRAFT_351248 [Glonium stellatum]